MTPMGWHRAGYACGLRLSYSHFNEYRRGGRVKKVFDRGIECSRKRFDRSYTYALASHLLTV
jgi:hypothetical protein